MLVFSAFDHRHARVGGEQVSLGICLRRGRIHYPTPQSSGVKIMYSILSIIIHKSCIIMYKSCIIIYKYIIINYISMCIYITYISSINKYIYIYTLYIYIIYIYIIYIHYIYIYIIYIYTLDIYISKKNENAHLSSNKKP